MKPISRLNASRIIARVDQQEAELVELVRDWLRSEENQARFDELSNQCSRWANLRAHIFDRNDEANDGSILNCFAAHGMNVILSKILTGWIAEFEEEGSSNE